MSYRNAWKVELYEARTSITLGRQGEFDGKGLVYRSPGYVDEQGEIHKVTVESIKCRINDSFSLDIRVHAIDNSNGEKINFVKEMTYNGSFNVWWEK